MTPPEQSGNPAFYDPLVIKDRFVASMRQTLTNLGHEAATHVRTKLIEMLGEWNPALLATPEALDIASEFVFTDEVLRDWIMNTKFVFYMNIASGAGKLPIQTLIRDLAIAASEDMNAFDMLTAEEMNASAAATATPPQVLDDLCNHSQAVTVFASNTWLVVPLLMFAFIDLDHDVLKTPEAKK